MTHEPVTVGEDGHVATVTLNRPDHLNALDAPTVYALLDRLTELGSRPDVRAVVLTGAGRAFCVGGDVCGLADPERQPDSPSRDLRDVMRVSELLHGMPKPTVAAINGPCAGGGLSFAAAADLRYAAASAVFATAYLKVGVPGDHGGIWTLTRAVGPSRARQLFLLGDRFRAEDAERYGLIHSVLPDAELLSFAQEVANRLARSSPSAVKAMKENLNDALHLPFGAYLDRETERFAAVLAGADAAEAARAFMEKRDPVFPGTD